MAEKHTYIVKRAMSAGTESFARGDERQMTEADAKHLVDTGALKLKPAAKPAPAKPAK